MIPEEARAVCDAWLDAIDRRAPGLVTGLYLRGGIGFGEYAPGQSDVDFVATLAHRPSYDEEEALEAAHAELTSRVPFDGVHLLAADLAGDPEDCPDVPCVLHGYFEPAGRYDLSPVAWHELAGHGVTVRGTPLAELPIWTDPARLRAFTRDNLDSYWRANAETLAKMPAEGGRKEACAWTVLGVARVHHLLVTGEMTTKSAAGRWGLGHYDERWHRVLREALRVREGGAAEYTDADERGADVAAFAAYVVEAGTAPGPDHSL